MFEKLSVDLGRINVGTTYHAEFPYKDIEVFNHIEIHCDCTDAKVDTARQVLIVDYKPKDLPPHLQARGFMNVIKMVNVTYTAKDNPVQQKTTLQIIAIVQR